METLAQVVAERVVEIVVQALDMNEIIRRIDLTAAIDQIDVNRLLDRVDVTEILDRVDVDRLLDQVDVDGLIERVDVDAIVQRVDVDGLLDRVDVNDLVNRIDVDTLVGQTDLGSIIAKSTGGFASEALDALRAQTVMIDQFADRLVWRMERRKGARPQTPSHAMREGGPPAGAVVPGAAVVPSGRAAPYAATSPADARLPHPAGPPDTAGPPQDGVVLPGAVPPGATAPGTALPGAVMPTGPVPSQAALPPQPASLPLRDSMPPSPNQSPDGRLQNATAPLRQSAVQGDVHPEGATPAPIPVGPEPHPHRDGGGTRARTRRGTWTSLHGHYAGGASRLAAFVIDMAGSAGAFTLALAAISYAVTVITGHTVTYSKANIVVAVAYVLWLFVYFAYPWSLSGKSLGMALLGIRVVAQDGTHAGWRRAVVRTLALPLSFLLLGLGLAGIVFQRQNRALHDFIAHTAVVYSWDARAARIRFLARADGADGADGADNVHAWDAAAR